MEPITLFKYDRGAINIEEISGWFNTSVGIDVTIKGSSYFHSLLNGKEVDDFMALFVNDNHAN